MRANTTHLRRASATSSRIRWVVVLLLVAVALVTALAWQAVSAMRARRQVTEHVLADYAGLAALVYATRITPELEYYAFGPALERLGTTPGGPLPRPEPIVVETEPGQSLSIPLVRSYWRLPLSSGELLSRGEDLPASTRASITDALRSAAATADRERWTSAALFLPGHPTRALVFRPVRDANSRMVELAGFDASLEGLAVYFDYSFTLRPLVPAPLTRGTPQDSLTSIEILTPAGEVIYRSRWVHHSRWSSTQNLGPRFGNLRARATLAPDAAEHAIPAGPPAAQAWLLVALGAVCAALLVGSIVQIRRESELQRLRMDFVMSASHELRTPLAQIRMFAETLRLGRVRDEGERARSLAILDQEATRLSHLIENLLTFSRAERRLLEVSPEPTDLAPLLRETVDGFAPLLASQDMKIEAELPDELRALADRGAVRQMVLNLLDNAAKYGPAGQTIRVAAHAANGSLEISVEDQGSGVPEADRQRICDRFVRLPQGNGSRVTGAGIGLSVVRDLATLQLGSVRVEGGQPGARFVIRLPSADV
jgi:signal transduction histidine kinase